VDESTLANKPPEQRWEFVSIDKIEAVQPNEFIDVIGVVQKVADVVEITSKKTGEPIAKRDITIADTSLRSINMTLWREQATTFSPSSQGSVLAIKSARVSDWNGRSLGTVGTTQLLFNPAMSQAAELKTWWNTVDPSSILSISSGGNFDGSSSAPKTTEVKTLGQIKDEGLGLNGQTHWIQATAAISSIKHNESAPLYYKSCPSEGCSKGVASNPDTDRWRCPKCQKDYDGYDLRYILSMFAVDHTGGQWLNAFNDTGEKLLQIRAEELDRLKNAADTNPFEAVFSAALYKYFTFKLKIKEESYNDQSRVKATIISVDPVDFREESQRLIQQICANGGHHVN